MSCKIRPGILSSSRGSSGGLEGQLSVAMQDIRTIFAQAQVYPKCEPKQLRIAVAGPPVFRTLSPDTRIVELDIAELAINYPGFPQTGRGLYDSDTGKIILCRDKWCRETLIHETFHSVSFGAARMDLRRRYLNFFEGLTEFFTGYVMFRRYPDCYQAWREQRYQECSVTYDRFVKLWAAFCRFIRIQELFRIYFWNGTDNWEMKCDEFLTSMHQAGYPNFGDFRTRPIPTVEMKILDECLKNFGRAQFKHLYESPTLEVLDFRQIRS